MGPKVLYKLSMWVCPSYQWTLGTCLAFTKPSLRLNVTSAEERKAASHHRRGLGGIQAWPLGTGSSAPAPSPLLVPMVTERARPHTLPHRRPVAFNPSKSRGFSPFPTSPGLWFPNVLQREENKSFGLLRGTGFPCRRQESQRKCWPRGLTRSRRVGKGFVVPGSLGLAKFQA